MSKDAILHIRINGKQKQKIEAEAKKQDLNVPKYVTEALEFYSSFDIHFLEQIYMTAEKMKLPMPIVIQQLLQAYISADYARMEAFGSSAGAKTYKRAFQYDENGLIEGTRHSDLVYEQELKEALEVRDRLFSTSKTGVSYTTNAEGAAYLASLWKTENYESTDHAMS